MENREKILIEFANNLRKLREDKDMSLRQLAAAAGLEYSQVQRIEKGKVNIAFTTLVALASGLNVELKELVAFEIKF